MNTIHSFFDPELEKMESTIYMYSTALLQQWRKVLRFKEGQELYLLDNEGHRYLCALESLDKSMAKLTILKEEEEQGREEYHMWLPLIKLKNIEIILKMCTEIGMTHFHFVQTAYSNHDMAKILSNANKQNRLLSIVTEAAEQSEKFRIPHLDFSIITLEELMEKEKQVLVLLERETSEKLPLVIPRKFTLGPEGGYSPDEKELIQQKNITTLTFPGTILRVETAAVIGAGKVCLCRE